MTTPPPTPVATGATDGPVNDGSGWYQVAICENGLKNDPSYGYFGLIQASDWPAGDSPANTSFLEQEAIANTLNHGHAPWCPPNCAAGGYKGW